jgi:hypothetical protein
MNIPAPLGNETAVFQAVSTHYTARTIVLDNGTICSVQVAAAGTEVSREKPQISTFSRSRNFYKILSP